MEKNISVSRDLLNGLRDIMAGGGTPQSRLDRVVNLIAGKLNAEVCSCYVMRPGEVLELVATKGLKPEAVNVTRLHVGEGLVGEVAAFLHPIALKDAWSHPNFAYRPETGEDPYHSFLGVPIIRNSRISGVIVVQTKNEKNFVQEEIETLETVAMLLAEVLASDDFASRDSKRPDDGLWLRPNKLTGLRLSGGKGMGKAIFHRRRIRISKLIAEDAETEMVHLNTALGLMHRSLDVLIDEHKKQEGEHLEIMETYKMFAEDHGWIAKIKEKIKSGLTAEAAVKKVYDDTWKRMSQVTDPYIKEKLHDMRDITDRLLQHLTGEKSSSSNSNLPEEMVIIARSMGPAELLDYNRDSIKGLVLEEGSPTMHVAIIARALNIPVVAQIKDITEQIDSFDDIIIDGDHGNVFVRPSEELMETFRVKINAREQRQLAYDAIREEEPHTKDGVCIGINLNAGLVHDMNMLESTRAKGIGLYRTEIPFMSYSEMPDVDTQQNHYKRIMDKAGGKPVFFRTLDIGADKVLPYCSDMNEENPAIGWRSIRITLDRKGVLRGQLRALIRAAEGRELHVMFPMISEVSEFDAAKDTLMLELQREKERDGKIPEKIHVGTMIEVPALAFQLSALLKKVDFVSVGSNDLMQFLFASDRGNQRLAGRYDELSPSFLRLLKNIAEECDRHGVYCSLCGEMAGSPLKAMALIGLGFRNLSVTAPNFGPVKMMIRSLNVESITEYINTQLDSTNHSLRSKLYSYAVDHGIII